MQNLLSFIFSISLKINAADNITTISFPSWFLSISYVLHKNKKLTIHFWLQVVKFFFQIKNIAMTNSGNLVNIG
jgi:hypothetical protein